MNNKSNSNLFDQIKKILVKMDPVQIASFSPENEFDDEINCIEQLLGSTTNSTEFYKGVAKLFLEKFGKDTYTDKKSIEEMSKRIWLLKETRGNGDNRH